MPGLVQRMMEVRGVAVLSAAVAVASCGGESSEQGGDAGVSNRAGEAGNRGGSAGAVSGRGGVGGSEAASGGVGGGSAGVAAGGTGAGGAGASSGVGAAGSGGGGTTGSAGESAAGGASGEAGRDQVGGAAGVGGGGGAGGEGELPGCGNGGSPVVCDAGEERCRWRVPITFRDFNAHDELDGHPDFAPTFSSVGAIMELVRPTLDVDGKPELIVADGDAFLHGRAEFAEWYRDTPGVNAAVERELVLWEDGNGNYVNRWGANGEAWRGCCAPDDAPFDGTPLFFPLDDAPNALEETRKRGKVPEQFGWIGWPWEDVVAETLGVLEPIETAWAPFPSPTHNFNFTSELKFGLVHDAEATTTIDVEGDDDIWVFVNGELAVDLGSFHVPLPGSVTIAGNAVTTRVQLDSGTLPTVISEERSAEDFGLVDGEAYEVAIFHAERQGDGATFRLKLSGVDSTRAVCVTNGE